MTRLILGLAGGGNSKLIRYFESKTDTFDIFVPQSFFLLGDVKLGQFEYLLWEYHQNDIIFRPIVSFQTDIGVDIEIPIFRYSSYVKFHTDIYKYFQIDMKYSVYWPALAITIMYCTLCFIEVWTSYTETSLSLCLSSTHTNKSTSNIKEDGDVIEEWMRRLWPNPLYNKEC